MFDRPLVIVRLLSSKNVSPSHASPRIPITAVIPAWQVLLLTIAAGDALANRHIIAAKASMTTAIVIGIETTTGLPSSLATRRRTGNSPAQTTTSTPPRNIHADNAARGCATAAISLCAADV